MTGTVSLAFVAGTVATLNPCGFALLPADRSPSAGAGRSAKPRGGERVLTAWGDED